MLAVGQHNGSDLWRKYLDSMENRVSKEKYAGDHSLVTDIPEVTSRCFQGEADYSLILSILMQSAQADQIIETASLEEIKRWCAPSNRFDPNKDILFAEVDNEGGEPYVIGINLVSWYTGMKDTRLYCQTSYLLSEWRDRGIWPVLVRRNERRLRDIAASIHSFTNVFSKPGRQRLR